MGRKLAVAIGASFLLLVLYLTAGALSPQVDRIVSERTVGGMTMQALPGSVKAGATIRLRLTVTGPAQYGLAEYNTCRPVWFWAEDANGKRAWTEVQFWACASNSRTEAIAPGDTKSFIVDWPTGLIAPGRYTVHGNFGVAQAPPGGNVPVVSIEVTP